MSGNRLGGLKAAETNKLKHGKDFYARIGRIGGKNGHTGGFAAMSPAKVSECGRIGGRKSSRAGIKNGCGKDSYRIKRLSEELGMRRIYVKCEPEKWDEYIEVAVKHG